MAEGFQNDHPNFDLSESRRSDFLEAAKGSRTPEITTFCGVSLLPPTLLGHGLSLAAGTALGMRINGSGGRVICMTSVGEWQEGSTWEALIFAAHHRLSNLTVLVDHNGLQGFGSTDEVASMSPLWERLKGFDIELLVIDGHDFASIRTALTHTNQRPMFVVMQTTKAKGVSFLEHRMDSHYLPVTPDQYARANVELAAS